MLVPFCYRFCRVVSKYENCDNLKAILQRRKTSNNLNFVRFAGELCRKAERIGWFLEFGLPSVSDTLR